MSSLLRQFRRAPGRIAATVLALALAVGAIGVLAIPAVSEGTLHAAVDRDGLADIVVATTPLDDDQLARIEALDGVTAAEGEVVLAATTASGAPTQLVGLDLTGRRMDLVHLSAGRMPQAGGEVVASPGLGGLGETIVANGASYRVVGIGGTLWWSDSDVLYAPIETVRALAPDRGTNRLVVLAEDDGLDRLREIGDAVRGELAADGDTFAEFPVYLPDGTTPIDADIRQVSSLIGMLGVVAGLVALVLLASTTNTLITERTREVAVMRALGGRPRPLRRRLRRIAVGITAVALAIGLPLGVLISNVIARMVLEKFVGVTPTVAVDWRVLVGSSVGMLLGARLVSARAARRITKLPLAEALRDREGLPFGRRWPHRLAVRIPTGGLFGRIATRASIHRPAHTLAVVAQIAAAVGAAFLVPSLAASVNDFNTATLAPWQYESRTVARDPGLPFDAAAIDAAPGGDEAGIWTFGEIGDWEVDVYGLAPASPHFDVALRDGAWFEPGTRQALVSAGFASRTSVAAGDTIDVDLAGGTVRYRIVGTVEDHARAVYVDRDTVAADLGTPGGANVVWSPRSAPSVELPVAARTWTAAELADEDAAGRDAIVVIFGAIGVVVAGVAALAVISSMTVSLYERRHELAALQALGARRRRLRGLLARELLPVAAAGIAAGLALGALGTRGIIASFEASNAVDIGVVDATGAIPVVVLATVLALLALAAIVVRTAGRRPVAVTLRGAA